MNSDQPPPSFIAEGLRRRIALAIGTPHGAELVHRLDGALLVQQGCSCREVAGWFGVHRRTVQRWVHALADATLAPSGPGHGGRPTALSQTQLTEVFAALSLAPPEARAAGAGWSGKDLARHVQAHYGLVLSERTCQRCLRRFRERASPRSKCDT